jgi:hypothetical protein
MARQGYEQISLVFRTSDPAYRRLLQVVAEVKLGENKVLRGLLADYLDMWRDELVAHRARLGQSPGGTGK